AIEGDVRGRPCLRIDHDPPLLEITAEAQLVRPANQAHVIANRIGRDPIDVVARSCAAEVETTGDAQSHVMRLVAVHLDSGIRTPEEVCFRPVDSGSIESYAERIHRAGSEQMRIPERE